MLSNMIDRLFPLLSGWNNFEGIIGAVLALLLGLWIGWDWEWKKLGVFGLSCAVIYGLGVWIEESRIMYLAVLGMCAAALMPSMWAESWSLPGRMQPISTCRSYSTLWNYVISTAQSSI